MLQEMGVDTVLAETAADVAEVATGTEPKVLTAEEKAIAEEKAKQKELDKFTDKEVIQLTALASGTKEKPGWANHKKLGRNPHIRRVLDGTKQTFLGTKAECEEFLADILVNDDDTPCLDDEGEEILINRGEIVEPLMADCQRQLFGKQTFLKTSEITALMKCSKKKLENMRRSVEHKLRTVSTPKWEKEGKDPSAFKLWIPSDSPRGQGVFDTEAFLQEANIDLDDM
jgi:hypothetical protein